MMRFVVNGRLLSNSSRKARAEVELNSFGGAAQAFSRAAGLLRGHAGEDRPTPAALKSENRSPEIRSKSEIQSRPPVPHSARSLRDTEAPVASVLSAEPMPESFAISAFGFRISDFLRISAFGFRISGLPAWLCLCGQTLELPCIGRPKTGA
jgi:hypothetical protein